MLMAVLEVQGWAVRLCMQGLIEPAAARMYGEWAAEATCALELARVTVCLSMRPKEV